MLLTFALVALSPLVQEPANAAPSTPSTASVAPLAPVHTPPSGCALYAEWRAPDATARAFAEHAVAAPLLAQLLATVRAENPDVDGLATFLANHFQGSASDELARLAGDGLALWVTIEQEQKQGVTLALVAPDAATGEARRAALMGALEAFAGAPGALATPTETFASARMWVLDEELFVLATDTNTYVSTSRRALEPLIEKKRVPRGRRALERLVATHAARAAGQDMFVWLDMGLVATAAAMTGATPEGDEPLARVAALLELGRDPQMQSLLGPGACHLADGESWSLGIALRGEDLDLTLASDGLASQPVTLPRVGAPAPVAGGVANAAHMLLYRDFATLLRERAVLFDATRLGDIAQQVAQFELLLGGLSLEEDVLPHLSPWLEVVSRPLAFDGVPRPEMQLPAAALIVRVEGAPNLGHQLDASFQSLVAIANIERTQNGEPAMVMQLGRDGDQTWTAARFLPPGPDEPVDARYNLMPAAALVGDHWILATHEELLRDLFDEVRAAGPVTGAAPATTDGARVERFALDGPQLAELARPQLDALALANALNEGKTREQARADMEGLVWILERTRARGAMSYEGASIVVRMELDFTTSGGPR
jgi:hypothetical protein